MQLFYLKKTDGSRATEKTESHKNSKEKEEKEKRRKKKRKGTGRKKRGRCVIEGLYVRPYMCRVLLLFLIK